MPPDMPLVTHREADRRLTKTERLARQKIYRFFAEQNQSIESVLAWNLREEVPDAWHTLEYDIDVEEPKVKITLRLDASVAKFYRGMGKGYQERINRILSTWATMKIGRFLELERKMEERISSRERE